jgi:hypothetical protein
MSICNAENESGLQILIPNATGLQIRQSGERTSSSVDDTFYNSLLTSHLSLKHPPRGLGGLSHLSLFRSVGFAIRPL